MPDIAQLRDFAERYTAAWCSQDPSRVAACYSADGSLTINDGAPAVGRDAITEAARSFMTAFPDLRVFFDDLFPTDEGIEYQWTLTGANTGPGGTEHRVLISGSELWQMGEDGLIASSWGRFDAADYQLQLEYDREDRR